MRKTLVTTKRLKIIGLFFIGLLILLAILNSYGLFDYYTFHRRSEPVFITGTVVDAKTGKPLNKAGIYWKLTNREPFTTTNKKGKFVIKTGDGYSIHAVINEPGYDLHLIDVPMHLIDILDITIYEPFGFQIASGRRQGIIRLQPVKGNKIER